MKRTFFSMIAVTGVLLASGAAFTASATERLSVNVPFSFVLGGKQFSAGAYTVAETNNGLVIVQGAGQSAMVLTVPTDLAKWGSTTGLRFTANEEHKLVGVQVEGEVGRAIPVPSFREHKLSMASR